MIKTRLDLKLYLYQDAVANGIETKGIKSKIKNYLNPRLRFTRNLRYYEFYANQPRS